MTYLKLLQGLKVDLYHHLNGSKVGLTMDKPRGEDKDTQDDEQESTSEAEEEDYYSSQESQEILDEERNGSEKEDQSGEVYVTRSGRTSKPPERLIYDAQACLLSTPVGRIRTLSWTGGGPWHVHQMVTQGAGGVR